LQGKIVFILWHRLFYPCSAPVASHTSTAAKGWSVIAATQYSCKTSNVKADPANSGSVAYSG